MARPARAAVVLALAAVVLSTTVAHAQLWSTPAQRVLLGGRDGVDVRARLRAHADSVRVRAPLDAGDALAWIGWSHLRAGHADSAAAAFAEARALRDLPEDAYALAEALLATHSIADTDSAARMIDALPPDDLEAADVTSRLWRAWAHSRTRDPEGERASLEVVRRALLAPGITPTLREHWARRLAAPMLGAQLDAWPLLEPLAARSRGLDAEIARMARVATPAHDRAEVFDRRLAAAIAREDSLAAAPLRAAGGRRLAVRGGDGTALGAWFFAVPHPRAPLVALVAAPAAVPGAEPDSFVAQLRRDGIAVLLLDPRGSRLSAVKGCALADDWRGHEDAVAAVVARDLSAAIGAAVATGSIDVHRIAAGAVGERAVSAATAARADARVRALVFVDPALAPTDRGPFVAALAAAGTPAFFQTGGASVEDNWVVDAVVAMLPPRLSRVAESPVPGKGLALFRAGPAEARRLSGWLRDSWSLPRATPPARLP